MDQKKYLDVKKQLKFSRDIKFLWLHLLGDFLLLTTFVLLVSHGELWSYAFSQLVLAIFFFRSFSLMHDAVHGSISDRPWVSRWVGYFYGGFCLLPFEAWRDIHVKHHYWSGNVDRDPTLAIIKNYDPSQRVKNGLLNFVWKAWLPILGFLQYVVFWHYNLVCLKEDSGRRGSFLFSILVPIATYVSLPLAFPEIVTWSTILPAFALYLVMVEVINFPHHLQLPMNRDQARLKYREQHAICRSCYYPKWLARGVLLNFNYHIEHHLFPTLPWYRLDEARDIVKEALGSQYNEVIGNAWILENRKVKMEGLIDPGLQGEQEEQQKAAA